MFNSRGGFLLLLALGSFCGSVGARSLTLSELAQALARRNPDLVSKRTEVERAQLEQKGVGRLNTPSLTAQTLYTGIHNKDSSLPVETDQQLLQAELGVTGRLYRWGLGYSLDYSYANQKQDKFETFAPVKKDGETVTLGLEYDLYRDAGFRVGQLPSALAAQRLRFASLDQRASYQTLIRDLFGLYLKVSLTQQQMETASATLREAEGLKKHYQALFAEGRLSKVELLSSEVQVATLLASVLTLKSQQKEQLRTLLSFSGASEDTRSEELQLETLPADYIAAEKVDALKASADRKSNGEMLLLDAERRVLDTEAEELTNKLLPSVKLVGGKSWQKNSPGQSILTEDDVRSDRWFVGVKLQVPLDGIGPRTDVAAKKVQAMGASAKLKLLNENVDVRLRGLFEELATLEEQLKVTIELERLNSERYKATLPLLERVSVARLDIFNYQNLVRDQRVRIMELQSEVLRRRAEVLYLNGTLQIR